MIIVENIWSNKNLYTNVNNSIIHKTLGNLNTHKLMINKTRCMYTKEYYLGIKRYAVVIDVIPSITG